MVNTCHVYLQALPMSFAACSGGYPHSWSMLWPSTSPSIVLVDGARQIDNHVLRLRETRMPRIKLSQHDEYHYLKLELGKSFAAHCSLSPPVSGVKFLKLSYDSSLRHLLGVENVLVRAHIELFIVPGEGCSLFHREGPAPVKGLGMGTPAPPATLGKELFPGTRSQTRPYFNDLQLSDCRKSH